MNVSGSVKPENVNLVDPFWKPGQQGVISCVLGTTPQDYVKAAKSFLGGVYIRPTTDGRLEISVRSHIKITDLHFLAKNLASV